MKKILLIDDEETLRESLSDVIEAMGYEIHAFPCIRQALTNVNLGLFNVIICDIGLPGEDAFEFTQEVKQSNQELIFILLSAFSEEEAIKKGLEKGADHYLVKPASIKALREAINSIPKYA